MTDAQVILTQIKQLDRMAMGAWGAKELMDMGDGLKFKTSGMVRWKGYVYVKYDRRLDLYHIDFFKIRQAEIKYTKRIDNVFVEDMVRLIDEVVG